MKRTRLPVILACLLVVLCTAAAAFYAPWLYEATVKSSREIRNSDELRTYSMSLTSTAPISEEQLAFLEEWNPQSVSMVVTFLYQDTPEPIEGAHFTSVYIPLSNPESLFSTEQQNEFVAMVNGLTPEQLEGKTLEICGSRFSLVPGTLPGALAIPPKAYFDGEISGYAMIRVTFPQILSTQEEVKLYEAAGENLEGVTVAEEGLALRAMLEENAPQYNLWWQAAKFVFPCLCIMMGPMLLLVWLHRSRPDSAWWGGRQCFVPLKYILAVLPPVCFGLCLHALLWRMPDTTNLAYTVYPFTLMDYLFAALPLLAAAGAAGLFAAVKNRLRKKGGGGK